MATSLSPISNGAAALTDTQATAGVVDSQTPNKTTFLKLLVEQIKNQDPLNPTDGAQFVAQLAQFSQLEQTVAMSQDIKVIRDVLAPDSTGTGTVTSPVQGNG